MTHQEFFNYIRQAYLDARKCTLTPRLNAKVLKRGTSRTISSVAEDIFAAYCAEKIKKSDNLEIIADPQISFKGTLLRNRNDKKALLIRPDVAVIKNSIITCMFDLKTDLGYRRFEFYDHAVEKESLMENIRNQHVLIKDGETKESKTYTISDDVKWIYIIVSERNINKGKQSEFMTSIRQLRKVKAYLLSKGDHLNSYHSDFSYFINEDEFHQLDLLLENELN